MTISFEFAQDYVALDPHVLSSFKQADEMHLGWDASNGKVPKAYKGAKLESKIGLSFNKSKNVLFLVSEHWGGYPCYNHIEPNFLTYEAILEGQYYAIVCGRVNATVFMPINIWQIRSLSASKAMKEPVEDISARQTATFTPNSGGNGDANLPEIYLNNSVSNGKDGFYSTPKPIITTATPTQMSKSSQPSFYQIAAQNRASVVLDTTINGKREVSRVFIVNPKDM